MTPRGPSKNPNRRPKGEGTIYQRASDGMWMASIELPSNGERTKSGKLKRRRLPVSAKTEAQVKVKLAAAKVAYAQNVDIPTGSQPLKDWLDWWWENEALKEIRPKTAATYRGILKNHIVPTIGNVRLDKLTASHMRKLADAITDKGLSSTTALQAHRVMSSALKSALREGKVTRNIASVTKAPRRAAGNFSALDITEAITVLKFIEGMRLESLFMAVLFTGAREGELLGLEISRAKDALDLSWQLQRHSWEHGCGDIVGWETVVSQKTGNARERPIYECGKVRGTDCPKRHLTFPADWEHRHLTGGLWLARPKSIAGTRVVPAVEPFRTKLRDRIKAAELESNPHGLVWTTIDGAPIDPGVFSKSWDALLREAKVTDVRLHDGRHSAVDFMLAAGVDLEDIKDIIGHSTVAQTLAYRSKGNMVQKTAAMNMLSRYLQQQQIEA